jgi:hypothetical protein
LWVTLMFQAWLEHQRNKPDISATELVVTFAGEKI